MKEVDKFNIIAEKILSICNEKPAQNSSLNFSRIAQDLFGNDRSYSEVVNVFNWLEDEGFVRCKYKRNRVCVEAVITAKGIDYLSGNIMSAVAKWLKNMASGLMSK